MIETTDGHTLAAQSRNGRRSTKTRSIGPVTFELVDRTVAVREILASISNRSAQIFAFCNMHTFNLARSSPEFAKALSRATVFNDGLGIDVASRIMFGEPFRDNLNGTDLTPAVLSALDRPTSIFLVGSPPGIAEQAAAVLERQFPLVRIVGTQHGYFTADESPQLVERIRSGGTELLLIGMGNPRQELWALEVQQQADTVIMCVGAFLDFVSGRSSRAPRFVRSLRLEWAYRLALEPVRLSRRYIGGALPFLASVVAQKYRSIK